MHADSNCAVNQPPDNPRARYEGRLTLAHIIRGTRRHTVLLCHAWDLIYEGGVWEGV